MALNFDLDLVINEFITVIFINAVIQVVSGSKTKNLKFHIHLSKISVFARSFSLYICKIMYNFVLIIIYYSINTLSFIFLFFSN